MGEIKNIKLNEILNNNENPRHEVGENQRDTLEKLFIAVGFQNMLNLAEDIKNNGLLGSQKITVVYSEEYKKYVAYDGNRRVAALKLLCNINDFKFLDNQFVNKVKKITKDFNVCDSVECYVTNKEEAIWIMGRLHLGEDNGRGLKKWSAEDKNFFNVSSHKGAKNISYLIYHHTKKFFPESNIKTKLGITTVQRIFNTKNIKKVIGLDKDNESTFTEERMKLVINAADWISEKSEQEGMTVTRLFNLAEDIERLLLPWINDYMKINHILAKEKVLQEKTNASNIFQSDDTNYHKKGSGSKKNLPYFFQGLKFGHLVPNDSDTHGITAICCELQMFSNKKMVENCPIASALLTRAIIEHSIKFYSKKTNIRGQDKTISKNIEKYAKLSQIIDKYKKNLDDYIQDKKMKSHFKALMADYSLVIDPLNLVVHNPEQFHLPPDTLINLPRKGLLALINYFLAEKKEDK